MDFEKTNKTVCNLCGKEFDLWDTQEDFCIEKLIGYGSVHDGAKIHMRLCCDCMDKLISDCRISPIICDTECASVHSNSFADENDGLIVEYTYQQEVANAK